ncbi:MAG: acyl-CoA dehydrogenase family protein [Pseudomonadales bacterium]|jgi:alkylation response protein AidB-like acyl-CoA dehydrogenase
MVQPRDFGFGDETAMLKDSAQRFLAELEPLDGLRGSLKGTEDPYRGNVRGSYYDKAAWQAMRDLGWHLVAIPEAAGGLGMGLVAAAAIQEEIGRAACPTPLTSTLQAVFVLREAAASLEAGASALLSKVADGLSVGLALQGEEGSLESDSTDVTVDGTRLSGTSWYVQDARKTEGFIVAAKAPEGIGLYHVMRDQLEVHSDRIVDLTRDQGRLVLDHVEAEVVAPPGEGAAVLARALPAVWTLIAADMAGAAEWQLQTTAEYAKVRVQFDRPIGFFQAVKHPLVNMMISTDETRSLVYSAACAYDTDPEDARRTSHLAKASASDTASFCSNRSTQLHGGIGFTWESDVQIYHKRQMHGQFLWGDGAWHRQKLAALL